jgi:uncharacterized protein DUF4340
MNERKKTLAFVGFAVLVGLLAWATQPQAIIDQPSVEVGTKFFPKFENPLTAKSLEITEFDEDQGALIPFEVTQVNGIWTIPSHSKYPADASKQMAEAAASLIDVKKLGIASTKKEDHEAFGVIDPTEPSLPAGSRGVGKKVVVRDGSKEGGGNVLAQFILGKVDSSQPRVRFVRIPGQDPVYRVEMEVDKLSTKFGDWIEKDLLKLNAFDVRQVSLNDYSVDEARGVVEQRALVNVGFDPKDNKWQLGSIEAYKENKGLVSETLAPNQELNGDKLNELKTALDDLQIVDVSRKPTGLSADLRVEDKLAQDRQSKISLAQHGFYVVPFNKQMVLFSNEGEVLCGTSEGVEYVLRFGEIAGAERDKSEKKEGDNKAADKPAGAGVSRYIMVTSRFNESLLPKPDLQALPGPQPEKKEPSKDDKKDSPKKDEKPSAEKPADQPGSGSAASAPAKEAAPAKEEKPKTEVDLERERIEKENKAKQDEYDSKVAGGKKKVNELNDRFADWYYIISDATYQKIHLGRKDVVKDKEAPKGEAGKTGGEPGAKEDPFQKFKDLKQGGVETK